MDQWAYYIIGYFRMESPIPFIKNVGYPIPREIQEQFANNAHVKRLNNNGLKPFCIYKGDEESRLLRIAVPLSQRNQPNELA